MDDIKRRVEEDHYEGPSESFLSSLKMEFMISEAKEEDLKRAEELTVRTHQLNATGVTYDYDELNAFRESGRHLLLVSELVDRYGSYGKIGLALVEKGEAHWHLKLMLMSCRVMARGVGTIMLSYIMQRAKAAGQTLRADFKQTDRNKQMYVGYRFANFKEISKGDDGYILLENDLSFIHPFPRYIKVETPESQTK
jgi:FkbH-like protein